MIQPTELAGTVAGVLAEIDAQAAIYLVDREQVALRLLRRTGAPDPAIVTIEGSLGGRSFMTLQVLDSPGTRSLWVPLVDGSDRLGVVEVRLPPVMDPGDPAVRTGAIEFVALVGHLVIAKTPYGDELRRTRRSQPMSVAGELLWRLVPPLTFVADNLLLSAVIEPCYDVGGDAFDYAVDDDEARIGIFDAVGHDLRATVTTALTVSAIRAARAAGQDLLALARAADETLARYVGNAQFTTAVLADIDLTNGSMRYVNAGHPPPVLVRDRKAVATLDGGRGVPLGLAEHRDAVGVAALEPGDRLLFYTDGIVEARDEHGVAFGLDRLVDFVERQHADGLPAPETLRRLRHAVLAHQRGRLQDDATLMMLEWAPHIGDRLSRFSAPP